jgi:hypothetical protein
MTATGIIKKALAAKKLSTQGLVDLFLLNGQPVTKASIDNKLSRGSFSADFFLSCLRFLEDPVQVANADVPISNPAPEIETTPLSGLEIVPEVQTIATKRCKFCKAEKPLADFNPARIPSKDGNGYSCISCSNARKENNAQKLADRKLARQAKLIKQQQERDEKKANSLVDKTKKHCPQCNTSKPVTEFYGGKDGQKLVGWCKDCCKARNKSAEVKEYMKTYSKNNKEKVSKVNQLCKERNIQKNTDNPPTIKSKKCCKCHEIKNVEEFSPRLGNLDGYSYDCRACRSKYDIERQDKKLAQENPERYKLLLIKRENMERYLNNQLDVKTCTGCGETKEISEFSRFRRNADGYYCRCKSCSSAATKNSKAKKMERLNNSRCSAKMA